jgi:hypothetical protein
MGGAPGAPSPAGSPMSQPSPAQGNQVAAMAKVRQATKLLEEALPDLGSESPVGKAVLTAIKSLASKAPQNTTTANADNAVMRDLAAKAKQQAPFMALQRAQGKPQASPMGGTNG